MAGGREIDATRAEECQLEFGGHITLWFGESEVRCEIERESHVCENSVTADPSTSSGAKSAPDFAQHDRVFSNLLLEPHTRAFHL